MQLVLDIGNTFIKAAWFSGSELLKVSTIKEEQLLSPRFFSEQGMLSRILIASVRELDPELSPLPGVPIIKLTGLTPIPLRNLYATPLTLGADRLANAVGGWARYPGKNVLVIDAGTCLKVDLVVSEGAYAGGSISPGLRMRYKALNVFTGKLPLLESADQAPLTGKTTAESIHSGVINGMAAEIDGIIGRYREQFPEMECIITGGDSSLFSGKLKSRIFAAPSLTLEGLNTILLHL